MSKFPKAEYADRILTHYITLAIRKVDGTVDSDVYGEMYGLIEQAVREAVEVAVREALSAIPTSVLE